jgi:hypothetical protein
MGPGEHDSHLLLIETEEARFVVRTQTCDFIRNCAERRIGTGPDWQTPEVELTFGILL